MFAVTIDEAWPGFGGPFTAADLDRVPSDRHRYELVDGALVVSPRPTTSTQPLTVSHPFTVTITPADLTKGLLR
jgi:hypothetical protein